MKIFLGYLLCIIGVILGVWFAIQWCFLGGFVQLAYSIRAEKLNDTAIMWAAVRIGVTTLAGHAVAHIFIIPGKALIKRHYLSFGDEQR